MQYGPIDEDDGSSRPSGNPINIEQGTYVKQSLQAVRQNGQTLVEHSKMYTSHISNWELYFASHSFSIALGASHVIQLI